MSDVIERMRYLADLELDLETTLAVMRSESRWPDETILDALHAMPRAVLDNWRDTIRLVEMPRGKKKF